MKYIIAFASLIFTINTNQCKATVQPANADSTMPKHTQSKADNRPNIIFILADDMGWTGPSSYGDPYMKTPNIDELAKGGMKFTQAYVLPVCSPSRAEFMTGQSAARTGMIKLITNVYFPYAPMIPPKAVMKLPYSNYNIFDMLHDAGYITGMAGKWHVGDSYMAAPLMKKRGMGYFNKYGLDYVGDAMEHGNNDVDKGAIAITNNMIQFIEKNKNHPFFAYLAEFIPHTPIIAPDSLVNKYLKLGFKKSTSLWGDISERPTADYLAMQGHLDDAIGILLKKLKELKLIKNTIIVFTSDNGALNRAWDNTPLSGWKGMLREGGIRVPMIIQWPGHIPAGSVNNIPVDIKDMYPTFAQVAGAEIPGSHPLDGLSLLPLLTKNQVIKKRDLYWYNPEYLPAYGQTPSVAMRQGNYKLIYYFGDTQDTKGAIPLNNKPWGKIVLGKKVELYNLKNDKSESHDLSGEMPAKTKEMLASVKDWLKRMGTGSPVKNPNADSTHYLKREHKKHK